LTKEGDTFTSSDYTVDAIDDPDNNTDNPGKDSNSGIVSRIIAIWDKEDTMAYSFTYDAQGRISQINSTERTFDYSYLGSTVTMTMTNNSEDSKFPFVLQMDAQGRGPATSGTGNKDGFTASYNDNGYVKHIIYTNNSDYGITTRTYNFVWTGGNLTSIQKADTFSFSNGNQTSVSSYTHTYVYGTTPAKGNFDIARIMASIIFNGFVLELGFLGKTSSTLLTSFTEQQEKNGNELATYEYKLNTDGYVTEMTCTTIRNNGTPRTTIVTVEYQ
jgi:YD repeat-containing protein